MRKASPAAKPKVTIRTVAEDAGVSVAAVSKVLRNAYGVSDSLRNKVTVSIEKLGYRPSTAARGMRGRTYTVGVLLVELRNPFLAEVIDGIKPTLSDANRQVLIGVSDAQASLEVSLIQSMMDMRVDGLILIAPRMNGEVLAKYAREIPIVAIGHHEPTADTFDTVNSDDRQGARLAVRALKDKGCHNIHMVNIPPKPDAPFVVSTQRQIGFLEGMGLSGHEAGQRVHFLPERINAEDVKLREFFSLDPLPDGVFCWSDIHGVQLLNEAERFGVSVPARMKFVGYDNSPTASLPLVGLSSIDQDPQRIGSKAAELLLSRIDGRSVPEHLLIEPTYVDRRSSQ
ncbi:LacI family DNA-binding transcriptional regulator [Qingshengfaniella alkalisoli]|uniref:LacI family transcriptional regulator n=1 Tax=Qingshengfaniella alkalisoli TaxID=2599296 RepID=A0A5B8IXF8_9RHOB|nr:LacI family DNA-binding transcriptional regulator [Qingshengfaniella alkalisoli]QDY70842.1 LacI family transcriptional regulator [Qingshengfaniella alkalisoli]